MLFQLICRVYSTSTSKITFHFSKNMRSFSKCDFFLKGAFIFNTNYFSFFQKREKGEGEGLNFLLTLQRKFVLCSNVQICSGDFKILRPSQNRYDLCKKTPKRKIKVFHGLKINTLKIIASLVSVIPKVSVRTETSIFAIPFPS